MIMDIDLTNANLVKANLNRLGNEKISASKDEELKEACAGFEAIFLNSMVTSMRGSLPGNALFKESNEMDIFQSMYDQSLVDELSGSGTTTGIKEFLYQQLKDSI
ncbi:MAG: flagellar biosynthesis protein FlgJ [Desulfobacteraceae bacterium]|nr:flagellar biosynthesis protein FlgJ [Desulfobacteraceae bacterium]